MASVLASGATLRHLRDLFSSGTAVGLTDGQLLARYAASHDGPAFAALVARHGPMVLATCRAVLRHEHDVEDAFQATFLVLAKKARSVRTGDALGGWLHRVAYRVAVQANIAVRQRRRREVEVSPMEIAGRTRPGLDLDLHSIVHEEIDRLPDRHRLPVVLCDLEGLSYDQAAARLDWTVPALRCRLSKARQRLRDRLTRRGVTGATLGVALASSNASASVPAAWAESAVTAATGGAGSMAAGALANAVIRSLLVTKLKIAAMAAIVAVGIASAGVLTIGAGRPDEPKLTVNAPVAAQKPQTAANDKAAASAGIVEMRGRVVAPDGKPVPGAAVRTSFLEPDGVATSEPDGRFLMPIPQWSWTRMLNGHDRFVEIVATAPGFGPGVVRDAFKAATSGDLTIRLTEDGPPIEGRIVNLEGRPVAGAQIKVGTLFFSESSDLTAWLMQIKERGSASLLFHRDHILALKAAITTKTGPDGRFQLTGLGRERVAWLSISGPTIATTEVFAMNRDGADLRIASPTMGDSSSLPQVIHSRRFEYSVAPTKPVEGVIRDKDTGQPIAGLRVYAQVRQRGAQLFQRIETTTDAQGRYRLTGPAQTSFYRLIVEQAEGKLYPKVSFEVPARSPALEPVTFDLALKRGIVIRGRVTDKATGQPAPGFIEAFTFRDNPATADYPGYSGTETYIKDDGRYEVVGLPGRNLIACRSEMRRYRGAFGAEKIRGEKTPGFDPQYYHALAEINIDSKAESATLDLQLDPGRSLTVNVVDPEGRPIGGTRVKGVTDLHSNFLEYEQESPTIAIHGLDPSKPRRVIVTHAGRRLIGTVYLKGNEAGPLTLRLQPWGTITGRVVDDDGQPLKGLEINSIDGSDVLGILPDDVWVGSDGRFRVERLVPGLEYGASASNRMVQGELFRGVTVAPGEVKVLGDLKVIPPKPDGEL